MMSDLNMIFGISGLKHPSLIKNFYPDDLPQEWYLDYYSNEFDLLLASSSELTELEDLEELIAEKDFHCLRDINSDAMQAIESSKGIRWQWSDDNTISSDTRLCIIKELASSTPKDIKELLERINVIASKQAVRQVYIVFEDNNALENCRQAVLLSNMMQI